MIKKNKSLQNEDGFTLIELMATLAILTMLVLIAVPAIGSITKKAEAQADDATISMIEKAGGLALLGDVVYDDPEEEQYDVATLVEEGYLDIDDSHKYAGSGNTVTRIKGYEFEFEGVLDPAEVLKRITTVNTFLNDSSNWIDKPSTQSGVAHNPLPEAGLAEPFDMNLPLGDYTMDVTKTLSDAAYYKYVLTTYNANGEVIKTYDGQTKISFTITEDTDTIMLRFRGKRVSTIYNVPTSYMGDKIYIDVQPK